MCPICGAEGYREMYRFEPARWIPGRVVRCDGCGTVYKIPSPTARPLTEYYDGSYADSDYWRQEEAALRALEKILGAMIANLGTSGLSLLDIGCGPGVFLVLAQRAGYEVSGLELNPELAQKARERTGAEVVVGDIATADLGGRTFDVITLLDLIEHVPDPVAILRRCRIWLKPGGHLVVYTPNHSGLIVRTAEALRRLTIGRLSGPIVEIFDCTHVVFFDDRTLRLALAKAEYRFDRTVLLKYDPTRSNQATGVAAVVLRGIEALSPLVRGQFRLLSFAAKGGEG